MSRRAYKRSFAVREITEPTKLTNVGVLYDCLTFNGRVPMHSESVEDLQLKLGLKKDLSLWFGLCSTEEAANIPMRDYVREGLVYLPGEPRVVSVLVGYKWDDNFAINGTDLGEFDAKPYYFIGRTMPEFRKRHYMSVMMGFLEDFAADAGYTHVCTAEVLDFQSSQLFANMGFTDIDPQPKSLSKDTEELLEELERLDTTKEDPRTRLAKKI